MMKALSEALILFCIFLTASIFLIAIDAFEVLYYFSRQHEDYEIDELLMSVIISPLFLAIFAYRRHQDAVNSQKQLLALSRIDLDSQLPNKRALKYQLSKLSQYPIALIKISHLQMIDTNFDSMFTDSLSKQPCELLVKSIKNTDNNGLIFRIDSNLFAYINTTKITAKKFVNNLQTIKKTFEYSSIHSPESKTFLSLIAGVSLTPPNYDTANTALEYAKAHPSESIILYSPNLVKNTNYQVELNLLSTLKSSIEKEEIALYFQPIINNKTQKIAKYEVLVRIFDQENNIIGPNQFLPLAKQLKLYPELSNIIIRKSFAYFTNKPTVEFSINLSWFDLINENTMKLLFKTIEDNPSCANRLTIEILESEDCDQEMLVSFRKKLKQVSVKFAIDDFGNGYSNWGVLRDINPDYLKIDGSLIQQIDSNIEVKMAVEAIIKIANAHQITTIAEYVSTESIYNMVRNMNIDMSQGYYFSPPRAELIEL